MSGERGNISISKWVSTLSNLPKMKKNIEISFIINCLVYYSGILRKTYDNNLSFINRSFQEYFVAKGLVKSELLLPYIDKYANNPEWDNIFRFSTGLSKDQARKEVLTLMWNKNSTLTLRCIMECDSWIKILPNLLTIENEDDIILIIRSLPTRVNDLQTIEALEPLFIRNHRSANILFFAVNILQNIFNVSQNTKAKIGAKRILDNFWNESKIYGIKPILQNIPGGQYWIGDDNGVSRDEIPRHPVVLNPFFIAESPVSNKEYKAFIPSYTPEPPYSMNDKQPVTNVTWYEASLYCQWLLGNKGRLPTEAEWEASCKGPLKDERQYPWGNKIDKRKANYSRIIGDTNEPGKYKANEFGLFDMSGNVFEWCYDWYDESYYKKSPPLSNPKGPETGRYKAMRGGCWARSPEVSRCSYRVRQIPSTRDILIGFRVAKEKNY